jgi:hypothetical protein
MEWRNMTNNNSMNDPKSIWQSQEAERIEMSAQEIRHKISEFRRRGQIWYTVFVLICLSISIGFAVEATNVREFPARRVGDVLHTVGWLAWAVGGISAIRRAARSGLSPDALLRTSVDFYRETLQQTRAHVYWRNRRFWIGFVPILAGTLILLLNPRQEGPHASLPPSIAWLPQAAMAWLPFVVLAASWLFLRIYGRVFSPGWLTQELATLDEFDKKNRA